MLILSHESWSALAEQEAQQLGEEGREPDAVAQLVERCRRQESFDERLWHEGQQLSRRAPTRGYIHAAADALISSLLPVIPIYETLSLTHRPGGSTA